MCEVLEGLEDDTEAALINLDQSKAFDKVDHRFLATVMKTAGFKPEFRKWISIQPAGSGAGEQEALDGFRDLAYSLAGLPLFPLSSRFGTPAP